MLRRSLLVQIKMQAMIALIFTQIENIFVVSANGRRSEIVEI